MSRAPSLLGADFFPEHQFCLKKQLVLGSFAAWGRTFSRNSTFFEGATCPGQLCSLGQNVFHTFIFLKKLLVWGSFAAWGRTLFRILCFEEDTTCPRQLRCLGQNCLQKFHCLGRNHLSQAASPPGAELFTEISFLLVPGSFAAWGKTHYRNCTSWKKPLVLGSFAAWGRTFCRKFTSFRKNHLYGAASLLVAEL